MNDERNPYEAPAAQVADPVSAAGPGDLADRMQRFTAALLDGLIGLLVGFPLAWALGLYDYVFHQPPIAPPAGLLYASKAIGFALFLLLHGYLLKTYGQTIGKRVIGTRIVGLDGQLLPFGRLVLLRYLPIQVLNLVPFLGPAVGIIDALFVFRDDRRCLHDLIAGTRVVKV